MSQEQKIRYTDLLIPETEAKYKDQALEEFFEDTATIAQLKKFLKQIKNTYKRKVECIYRIRRSDRTEYLIWGEKIIGKTDLGQEKNMTISNIGRYENPVPHIELGVDDDGNQSIKKDRVERLATEYSVSFSKEAADELWADRTNDFDIRLYVRHEDEIPVQIIDYEQFANAPFDRLYVRYNNRVEATTTTE